MSTVVDSGLREFGKIATKLSRNPLGLIALFIVLIYGVAGLVATSTVLSYHHRSVLVGFLAGFPVLVLYVFYLLVANHWNKLYAPSDFSDEANYLRAIELRPSVTVEDRAQEAVVEAGSIKVALDEVFKADATDTNVLGVQYVIRWNSPEMKENRERLAQLASTRRLETPEDVMSRHRLFKFFEELALNVNRGTVNKSILEKYLKAEILQHWTREKDYIQGVRREMKAPHMFTNLEQMVATWEKA